MLWEERLKDCKDIVWRFKYNLIIKRNQVKDVNSIFNSVVVLFKDGFVGVFRVDDRVRRMNIRCGFSKDGYNWEIVDELINFIQQIRDLFVSEYKYDLRVIFIEDRYYIIWCNGYYGLIIGVGYIFDFEKFYQIENVFLLYNRNGVFFLRKINGKYVMFFCLLDMGYIVFGDIFYSESFDMIYWGCYRYVMLVGYILWQLFKIGVGFILIEISEGWLLIYYGVFFLCNGYVYSFGVVFLDLEKLWIVKVRLKFYFFLLQEYYECVGDVLNVVFLCVIFCDVDIGRFVIYYGGVDIVVNFVFVYVQDIIEFFKRESQE